MPVEGKGGGRGKTVTILLETAVHVLKAGRWWGGNDGNKTRYQLTEN